MMNNPDSGSSEWMSDTRPARLFSHGSMPNVARAVTHRVDRRLERQARQCLHRRIGVAARQVGICSRQALEGDRHQAGSCCSPAVSLHQQRSRARSRSSAVSTPNGPCSIRTQAIRIPFSSARNCSRLSRRSSGTRRQRDDSGPARRVCRHKSRHDASVAPGPRESAWREKYSAGAIVWPRSKAQAALTKETAAASISSRIGTTSVPMSTFRIGQRRYDQTQALRVQRREITLQIDHDIVRPSGSSSANAACTRSDPDGSAGSVSTARPPAARTAVTISGSPQATATGPISGLPPTLQHMHDHRLAADVGQRLAGQARGGHTGGDHDDWVQAGGFMGAVSPRGSRRVFEAPRR